MSTPISQGSRLQGPELYAPQRVRAQMEPEGDVAQAETPPLAATDAEFYAEASAEPPIDIGTEPVVESAPAPPAQIDEALAAAIELGRPYRNAQPPAYEKRLPPAANLRLPHGAAVDWPPLAPDLPPPAPPRRLRLDPDIVPEPPIEMQRPLAFGSIARFALIAAVAAVAAYGLTLIPSRQSDAPVPKPASDSVAAAAPASVVPTISAVAPAMPAQSEPRSEARPAPSRLVVESQQAFVNEPLAFSATVKPSSGRETLVLGGLVPGTRLSAGGPVGDSGWRLPSHDLDGLYLYAPKDFLGVMNTAINLFSRDKELMDSHAVQLEWVVKKSDPLRHGERPDQNNPNAKTVPSMDPDEIAVLMKRGQDFLNIGDITAARIVFRRLADAGVADGALAAAATYDSRYLAEHNVLGVRGDEAKARAMYQRAAELGSTKAASILEHMATK